MRTSIGALNVTTKGYDVVAELEAQGDKYGMAKYIRENKKECEEKARQYLAEHPKTTYYVASGYPTMMAHEDFTPEPNYSALIPYTEDEIERIKQLIVQVWNEADSDSPIQSIDDIDDFCLSDWEGANEELDHLIWERAEFYYLLTEQLFDRCFSFNRLLLYNAPLAQKICDATDGNVLMESISPYVIIMTEVVKDMETIEGHDPVHDDLYFVSDDVHSYHSHLIIERDKIEVYWEDLPRDDFNQERMTSDRVEGIDAKAVLKLFEAKDYYELLDRIKERFHEETAYDDLLTFLRENGITI